MGAGTDGNIRTSWENGEEIRVPVLNENPATLEAESFAFEAL